MGTETTTEFQIKSGFDDICEMMVIFLLKNISYSFGYNMGHFSSKQPQK